LKQFVLDHFQSVYCGTCRLNTDEGDLLIELHTGQKVAVTVINRGVRFGEVEALYEKNTERDIHTLFVVDQRMIPPDQSEVEPPAWMLAIHNLTNGRIYSYTCDGRAVSIRPLHFGWKWGSKTRPVQYGNVVDTAKLSPHRFETMVGVDTGVYATVNFGEGAFWKKQDPRGGQYTYYSWRTWRYSEHSQKQQTDHTADAEWESWEEFNRNYESDEHYNYYEEQRRQQTPPRSGRQTSDRLHYMTLGVPVGASLDEVKQAYRRKAREYHPDLHPDQRDLYTTKMADINAAYEALSKKLSR
jgi:hypothetical protein